MTRYYLGLSTSGHDPALALVNEEGVVLFAEATERLLQDKRAWGAAPDHPAHVASVLNRFCKEGADFVVATSWSRVKDNGVTRLTDALLPASEAAWLGKQQKRAHTSAGDSLAYYLGLAELPDRRDFEHHLCHAAYAAHTAPFDDAVCVVIDGEGDVGSVSVYRFFAGRLKRLWRSWGPGSLGSFYISLTRACGFDWKAGEEWKVMGLAAFGSPQIAMTAPLARMLRMEDGRVLLADSEALWQAMEELRGFRRQPDEPFMNAANLAASGQAVYAGMADAVLAACSDYGTANLILSGGCALNSSYNGSIRGRLRFERVHVPPAPADDGNAVGAALLAWMQDHPEQPLPRAASPFLGSTPARCDIEAAARNAPGARVTDLAEDLPNRLADVLSKGRMVGVMRGAAEFGPRALGNRSILADPRPADMKDRLNQRVKGREPYRPFAPIIPAGRVVEWFCNPQPSPYMSFTLRWKAEKRAAVPAVVHQDGTGRLQTVEPGDSTWLSALLAAFEARSGVPILLNTSFNVMGKPIVHSVQDAMAVMATTGLDAVLLDHILIEKDPS